MAALVIDLAPEESAGERLPLWFKVGIARCGAMKHIERPQLLRRLQGCLINLRGREENRIDWFEYH